MSTVKTNNLQLGQSVTATNNFTWYQPSTPDGTVRLGNGNSGSVTDLVTLTSAGNLGIGTSSPGYKLDIQSTSNPAIFLANTTSGLNCFIGTSGAGVAQIGSTNQGLRFLTNNAEVMRLDSSGNLGLGLSPSAWHSNFKALQTGNNYAAFVGDGSNGYAEVLNNCYASGASTYNYYATLAATRYSQQLGSHKWYIAGAGSGGSAISWTQAMTLDASGNLLVGLTASAGSGYTLQVKGAFNFTDSSGNQVCFYNPSNGYMYMAPVYNKTTAAAANVFVGSAPGDMYRSTSALKYKQDIRDLESIDINKFRPVRYRSKCENDDQSKDHFGIIADEALEAGFPELVIFGADGEPEGFQYERLTAVLVKAIQELSAELNLLKQKVNA